MKKNFGICTFPCSMEKQILIAVFVVVFVVLPNTYFVITFSFLVSEISVSFSKRLLFVLIIWPVKNLFCNIVILNLPLFFCTLYFNLHALKLCR